MFYTKRYIFHYDVKQPSLHCHTKMLEHNNMECTAFLLDEDEDDDSNCVNIRFDDGFETNVFIYELEAVK